MKNKLVIFSAVLFFSCMNGFAREEVPYGVSGWGHVLGNHRAIVEVTKDSDAVIAHIPWRRRDEDVKNKAVLVFDMKTGQRIKNVYPLNINREFGDIVFQPKTVPGLYAVYYYPLERNKNRPTGQADFIYAAPKMTADDAWVEKHGLGPNRYLEADAFKSIPRAKTVKIESRTAFDSFYPMEVIATSAELSELKEFYPDDFLLFPESREYPIKMSGDLPLRWIKKGPADSFEAKVDKDEYFAFQVGVYASKADVENLTVVTNALAGKDGRVIPKSDIESINTSGVDALGKPFSRELNVEEGKVQALWFVVHVPKDANAGTYSSEILIGPKDGQMKTLKLTLDVQDRVSPDGGVSDINSMARLLWLNSSVGLEDTVTAPFTPMSVKGREISCLGKKVILGVDGLPTSMQAGKTEILSGPVKFDILVNGRPQNLKNVSFEITKAGKSCVSWKSLNENDDFSLVVEARMEFDGYAYYNLQLTARKSVKISDALLLIPYDKSIATYMMGLNTGRGGYRQENVNWKWQERPNNKVWIGDVEAGLRCKLRGEKSLEHAWAEYLPEVNGIPTSWSNGGVGGCTVSTMNQKTVLMKAYSGPRELAAGDKMDFNFSLLITPVRPRDPQHWIDPRAWDDRFSMMGCSPQTDKALGAKYATAFHASPMNPYINYPFQATDDLRNWVDEIHKNGMRAKVYYKIGELSNHCAELWALRSLGGEVLLGGPGGGGEWLREHLVDNYQPKWYSIPFGIESPADASLATTGMSRWNNYYATSIGWLVENLDIDGLYYDGIQGYSRQMIQRVRRVVDRIKPGSTLDFHGGNTITRLSNSYNDVMEHLPYFDCTWIGEGFNYDGPPDFYMVELSGIPYGVPNAMLQYGGNPWRGMLYGMSSRYIECHSSTPTNLWKFWDKIRIQDSRMLGYWDKNSPVRTNNKDVLATVYQFKDKALIAIASWAKQDVDVRLSIDYKSLGMNPRNIVAYAPEIPGYQPVRVFDINKPIPVEFGKGWLILLEPAAKRSLPVVGRYKSQGLSGKKTEGFTAACWQSVKEDRSKGIIRKTPGMLSVSGPVSSALYLQRDLPGNISGLQVAMKMQNLHKSRVWHNRENGMEAPGIAVVFGDGKTLRIYPASHGVLTIDDGILDHLYKKISLWEKAPENTWLYLRIWWDAKDIYMDASVNRSKWETFYTLPRELFKGLPTVLRLGKMKKPYGWPRTLEITNKGPIQKAEYENVLFLVKTGKK